jgi:hypothetical protein
MRRFALAAAAVALFAQPALAVSITPAAFTAAKVVESFEGIGAGTNVGSTAYANIFSPGVSGPYTFASGMILGGTNPGLFQNGAFLHDAAIAGASNGWGTNGTVSTAAQVPDPWGVASSEYLGAFDSLGTGSAVIDISFTTDMRRVGAWVAGAAGSNVTLDVYSAANVLLESVTIAAPTVASWGSSFLGIERSEGIRRIVFRGADFGIDGVTFEAASVPEPRAALLASVGVLGLWWMGGRRAPRAAAAAGVSRRRRLR